MPCLLRYLAGFALHAVAVVIVVVVNMQLKSVFMSVHTIRHY